MASRRYALTRLAAGLYVVPSNDGTRIWRIHRYAEDGSLERPDGTVILGNFWEAAWVEADAFDRALADPYFPDDLWNLNWRTDAALCKTRREAIGYMERAQL